MPTPFPDHLARFLWMPNVWAFEAEASDWLDGLSLDEARYLGGVSPKRRGEFTAGRNCARAALSMAGISSYSLLGGVSREPLWPPNVVGSITHCEGFCAAVVALQRDVRAIAVDAEPNLPLPVGVDRLVINDDEAREQLVDPEEWIHGDRLVFSAKESVFKAWFPLTRRRLRFSDVSITIHWITRSFVVRSPMPELVNLRMQGRFSMRNRTIISAVTVKHDRLLSRSQNNRL